MTCAIPWCVGLPRVESVYCAVHQRNPSIHPVMLSAPDRPTNACRACRGSGVCPDCGGEGIHTCEHGNCYDEHDCGSCDGTGKCEACGKTDDKDEPTDFDVRYLRFAFDAGWQPPVLVTWPWETPEARP